MNEKKEVNYEKASNDLRAAAETNCTGFSARIEEMNSLLELQSSKEKRESKWKIVGLVLTILAIVVAIFAGWESILNLLSAVGQLLTQ